MTEARGDRGEPAAFSSSRKTCRRCGAGLIDVCCYVRCFVKTYVTPTKFFSGPSSDATAISDFCGGCGGRGCPWQKFRERRFYIPYIYMSIFIGSIDKYMLYIYMHTSISIYHIPIPMPWGLRARPRGLLELLISPSLFGFRPDIYI